MNDFSLVEKINILMKLISSSPLFLILTIICAFLLIFGVVCIVLNKKINKWVFIIGLSLFVILMFINYSSIIFKIFDIIIDSVFTALYFPNLPIYISVILIINIYFIVSIFSKKQIKRQKIVNTVCAVLLDLFLILIIDLVSRNNINIYEEVNLFTNSILLVLLQLSMGIFVSWILLNLVISAHIKLKKYDDKEYPKMQEIMFEEN